MPGRRETDVVRYSGSRALVYLIHGVTGTPSEMRYLASGLCHKGLDAYATTLPGHCGRLRDLVRSDVDQWLDHILKQLRYAREHYDSLFVVGLSAGGSLALEASTLFAVDGIGVLSPTLIYDGWNTPWSHAIMPLAMKLVPYSMQHLLFHLDGPPYGIKDPALQSQVRAAYHPGAIFREWVHSWWPKRRESGEAEEVHLSASKGNPIFPLKTLTDIDRLIVRIRRSMERVTAPTIILQAREDDMTSPRNAQLVYDAIRSKAKQIVLLDDCYHVITVDKQKKAVIRHLADFFKVCASQTGLLAAS